MSTFSGVRTDGLSDIDSVLVQEANRIGADIHAENVHTSPWLDLIPKGTFPEGMGYRLQSLIYERALPTNAAQDEIGLAWGDFAGPSGFKSGQDHSTSVSGTAGLLNDSVSDFHGPLANDGVGTEAANSPSRIDWQKRLEPYSLKRATVWSPEINVDDLRFAAHRNEQLSASFDALAEGVRYGWEERYRDEYQRVCNFVVECLASSTITNTSLTGGQADDRFDNAAPTASTVNIGNGVMDKIYNALVRAGAGKKAYGMENGRPVFALVCSSEASFTLQTETQQLTDMRESSRVDELLAPLGVSKSFRGFYHIIDDLAPRYRLAVAASDGTDASGAAYTDNDYKRVEPNTISSSVIIPNTAYEASTAKWEVAFVLHKEVMESLIPNPVGSTGEAKFDPVDYSGRFHWVNIKSVDLNPLGTVGNFLGVLASATKPLKTKFGYAIIFDRTSANYAG